MTTAELDQCIATYKTPPKLEGEQLQYYFDRISSACEALDYAHRYGTDIKYLVDQVILRDCENLHHSTYFDYYRCLFKVQGIPKVERWLLTKLTLKELDALLTSTHISSTDRSEERALIQNIATNYMMVFGKITATIVEEEPVRLITYA